MRTVGVDFLPKAVRLVLIASILVLVACGGTSVGTTTTTRAEIGAPPDTVAATSTTISGRASAFGFARDRLTGYDAADAGLGRVFVGDQPAAPAADEDAYTLELRKVVASAGGEPVDWTRWEDEDLLFFGYLYCLVAGNGDSPEKAVANVTAEVARLSGSTESSTVLDFATAVYIANYAAGGLCGEHYLPTREYLESL